MKDDLIELEVVITHHPIIEHPELPDTIVRLKSDLRQLVNVFQKIEELKFEIDARTALFNALDEALRIGDKGTHEEHMKIVDTVLAVLWTENFKVVSIEDNEV